MYKKLDIKLEVGDVILEHTNFNPKEDVVSILSALIRFFTRNYWNHAKYVVESNGKIMIQEALAKGIVERTPIEALKERDILVMKPVTPLTESEKRYYSLLAEELKGVKYDYFGTMFFQLIKQLTGLWLGSRDIRLDTPKYCSEAPMTLHRKVRHVIKKCWGYSPADIRNENYFKPVWAGIVTAI
jgi:hypothetical protein